MLGILPKRFADKVYFSDDGCWLWTAKKVKTGYGQYSSEGRPTSAHRFAWECFNGDILDGLHVLHKCDVRSCVNPNHLFLGTHQDNMDDKVSKGRSRRPSGEQYVGTKLTKADSEEIISLYRRGRGGVFFSRSELAKKFKVTEDRIGRIVNKDRKVAV